MFSIKWYYIEFHPFSPNFAYRCHCNVASDTLNWFVKTTTKKLDIGTLYISSQYRIKIRKRKRNKKKKSENQILLWTKIAHTTHIKSYTQMLYRHLGRANRKAYKYKFTGPLKWFKTEKCFIIYAWRDVWWVGLTCQIYLFIADNFVYNKTFWARSEKKALI